MATKSQGWQSKNGKMLLALVIYKIDSEFHHFKEKIILHIKRLNEKNFLS